MDFFRGTLNGTTFFISPHQTLPGARRVADPVETLGNDEIARIAGEVAKSPDDVWFGTRVDQLTAVQKVAHIAHRIQVRELWVHIRVSHENAPLHIFRLTYEREVIYVTDENWVHGASRVIDRGWLRDNANAIATTVATAPQARWFGVDVSALSQTDKMEWVENNLLSGRLKVFVDRPNSPQWPWRT